MTLSSGILRKMPPAADRIRILNLEPEGYSPAARELLNAVGVVEERALTQEELLREIGGYDVLITRLGHRIDDNVLAAAPRLRAIVSATTGLDHIDLTAAERRRVKVLSLKGERAFLDTITATAEHAFGLLLAVVRQIPSAHAAVVAGRWQRDDFKGRQLRGLRLGIVGLGRLGSMMARYGSAFGLRIAGYDPHLAAWPATAERCDTLQALARRSDILSIHVPLTDETRNLIDAKVIGALPAGAVVVNTARGGVLDETALAIAIEEGRIAGAGIDVLTNEVGTAHTPASPLVALARQHPGIVLTPHIGGATRESMQETEVFMAGRLVEFLQKSQAADA